MGEDDGELVAAQSRDGVGAPQLAAEPGRDLLRQQVISPSWSVPSGVGTSSYSFVWAMAGENQAFNDMDPVPITDMR